MQQFWAFLIENEFMMKIDESVDHVRFNTEAAVKLFRINYLLHYCFPPSQIQPSGAPTRRHHQTHHTHGKLNQVSTYTQRQRWFSIL